MIKRGAFGFYWMAHSSISLASVVYIMVLTTFMYQETGSAFMASLYPLISALARLVAGLTAPLIMEKFDFSKLLVRLQVCKGIFMSTLVVLFPYIYSRIELICLFILLIAFTEGWGNPLIRSLVPRIVPADRLVKANSSLSVSSQSLQIAGYTFTGFIVIQYGHIPTLVIACILIWVSVAGLGLASYSAKDDHQASGPAKPSWQVMREGWTLLWRIPTLRMVTLMDMIEGVAGTIWVGAITLVYVKEVLNQGEEWWGFINASYYAGAILGGLLSYMFASFIQKNLVFSMAIGSAIFSLLTLWYGLNSTPIIALVLCIAMGPAYQMRDVAQQTAFQSSVEPGILSKVYASHDILISTITSISIAFIGFIADTMGIRMVYIVGAVFIAISAGLSLMIVRLNRQSPRNVQSDHKTVS
ncbi:MFS transporter [Paenibacillus sp. JCM 10914]|uniref:MFS transporter n=1 Tax=Paenibacillus sp. JCM 10914 TaxID=1236974 RepID=UPI0003CCA3E7|nr:MFS transporter [Paenibacillus sp. JCM 10914]GAE04988.1 macrolide-efflux protein [Paenibacillus sp. JCM 10914]